MYSKYMFKPSPETFAEWSLADLVDELLTSEPLQREGKTARTLVKSDALTVVLTALRAGASLHAHDAPGPVMVVPVRGEVVFEHGDSSSPVAHDGARALAMGPGLRHTVQARVDSAFLLIIGPRA